jgi:hypothetical protein
MFMWTCFGLMVACVVILAGLMWLQYRAGVDLCRQLEAMKQVKGRLERGYNGQANEISEWQGKFAEQADKIDFLADKLQIADRHIIEVQEKLRVAEAKVQAGALVLANGEQSRKQIAALQDSERVLVNENERLGKQVLSIAARNLMIREFMGATLWKYFQSEYQRTLDKQQLENYRGKAAAALAKSENGDFF